VDVRDLVQRDPGAQALADLRVGGEAAADPDVEAGAVLRWFTPTKATSLISCATSRRGEPEIAVLNLRGRFEKSLLPMTRRWISSMAGVPSMISSSAIPATGEPKDDAGGVTAGLGRGQAHGFEALPDLRDVLDADPVVLHVLPVGEIGGCRARTPARSRR